MSHFFKPLLGAVILAATGLTSTTVTAANAQITITAPKNSAAESAAKNKTLPTGVIMTTCADKVTEVAPNILNMDQLTFTVKYDAGKAQGEIGDVYVVLQNLSEISGTASNPRYIFIQRKPDFVNGFPNFLSDTTISAGVTVVTVDNAAQLATLDNTSNNPTFWSIFPYMPASANLGVGAQTEIIFGGSLDLTGVDQGLWTASVIIAKPSGLLTASNADWVATNKPANAFAFTRPDTWAAYDTAAFIVGTPTGLDTNLGNVPVKFDVDLDGIVGSIGDVVPITTCR